MIMPVAIFHVPDQVRGNDVLLVVVAIEQHILRADFASAWNILGSVPLDSPWTCERAKSNQFSANETYDIVRSNKH